jgi:hypothetical protein
MTPGLQRTIRSATQSVLRLVEQCRKEGPMYTACPRATAQVSRTGKALLNAITVLKQTLDAPATSESPSAS